MTYYRGHTVGPSQDPTVSIMTTLLITAPEFQRRESTSDVCFEGMAARVTCVLKEWLRVVGLEGLRGIGTLELNTQHCGETQRKIHERDRLRIQHEQKKNPANELRPPES